jgi:hypothetical protein
MSDAPTIEVLELHREEAEAAMAHLRPAGQINGTSHRAKIGRSNLLSASR